MRIKYVTSVQIIACGASLSTTQPNLTMFKSKQKATEPIAQHNGSYMFQNASETGEQPSSSSSEFEFELNHTNQRKQHPQKGSGLHGIVPRQPELETVRSAMSAMFSPDGEEESIITSEDTGSEILRKQRHEFKSYLLTEK